jgi:hypothetical protein
MMATPRFSQMDRRRGSSYKKRRHGLDGWLMKTAFEHAVLPLAVALTAAAAPASAESYPPIDGPFEVTLDMDNDGAMDRAVLVRHSEGGLADLSIYLAAGDGQVDPSGKPTFVKKDLTAEGIVSLEGSGNGSLTVTYGCGGCSNDYETALAIAYRGGEFLVAGYTYSWETRDGAGSCDINYLTGKGVITLGLDGEGTEIKEKFTPVKLADWSHERYPKACDL